MSKILRKCLSLVLVFMLLASLSVNGALNASADNKTGDGLAAYAMTAYNEGWRYVWGGASYGAVDCSGLIYSYVGGGARVTEDMLYSSPESGYVSDGVPDIPGLGLWQPGHVGVYVGGGMAVDARDEISNVCYQSVSTKSWVMWFKVDGVSYGTGTAVAKEQKSESDVEKTEETDRSSELKPADETLRQGSTGAAVNALQERLKELGYFTDNTTEYFGTVTKGALEEFQSVAGLNVTGVYDAATKKALEADNAPRKPEPEVEEEPESSEPEDAQPNEEVQSEPEIAAESDSESSPAAEEPETATPSDSQNAENAEPQTDSEPEEDDEWEKEVFAQFEEYEDGEQSSANGSQDSDSDQDFADAVYKPGDEAAEISDIQYILIKLGYFDYDITGTFCENTADAVEAFRCDNELGDKRYLDSETIDALYSAFDGGYEVKSEGQSALAGEIDAAADDDTAAIAPEEENGEEETHEQSVTITLGESEETVKTEDTDESAGSEKPAAAAEEAKTSENSDVSTDEKPESTVKKTASEDNSSVVRSPKTGDRSPAQYILMGLSDRSKTTLALIVIGASMVLIFFLGTVHYWNVSIEKRRQRERRAAAVSSYRRN